MELEILIEDFSPCLCFGDNFLIASGDDGFLLQKTLLIEKGEDFFIVQLIVVPRIGVLRVSLALRRSTILPFSIISIFVLPLCFAFILGIFAVSSIKESFLLAAGVTCSLFVIFDIFKFCADLPIFFAGLLGSFSRIELPKEWVLYAVVIYIDLASIFLFSIILLSDHHEVYKH